MATTWRGNAPEARIRAHVAVVDAAGRLLHSVGNPDAVTTMRSCVKPLQALPFLRLAADQLRVEDDEVAVACASHWGEPIHERTVRKLLARTGLGEDALACGPQLPLDPQAAGVRLAAGLPPRRIDNTCSGKHAAMLATCVVEGWPTDGYQHRDHPLQSAVAGAMGEYLGVDLDSAPSGVDGCSLPTFGVPLRAIAHAFAAAQRDPSFRRAQEAMATRPLLVSGTGRFDTVLLAAAGARLTAKIGGAAVWAACIRPEGPGIAIKLEAGLDGAIPPVALAVLGHLGLNSQLREGLAAYERPLVRNWAGEVVGETRVEEAAFRGFGPLAL